MSKSEQEIEAKFLVRDLSTVAQRLETLGARIIFPRVFEVNLRFDTPSGSLTSARQVLRLRQDAAAFLTFKGPQRQGESVSSRQEIEFQVSDFTAARHLLEALGYRVAVIYEKYRTTYQYGDLVITLDEMPFGSFIEIEGPNAEAIQSAADRLYLDWEARSATSYLALFNQLRAARGLAAQNLTFDELRGFSAVPEDLGLRYAG